MPRDRNLAADLWTCEALVHCRMESRVLFLAMQNFADDHGVQPCRPFTIRLQAFPGDTDIDDARLQAMIDELVSRKLLRIYEVAGQAYVAIVDWATLHRVPKRARRKHPADPSIPEPAPATPPLSAPAPAKATGHTPPEPSPPAEPPLSVAESERPSAVVSVGARQLDGSAARAEGGG